MRIAVIGTGYWGSKVADAVDVKYSAVRLDVNDNVSEHKFDAAIVCTPAEYHHSIALHLLHQSIPVLVEKPVAVHLDEVKELCDVALHNNTVLQAGHVLCFTPTTNWIHTNFNMGQLRMLETRRMNFGSIPGNTTDLNLHLAVHDVALIDYFTRESVQEVEAKTYSLTSHNHPDYIVNTIKYESFIASLHSSWYYPSKQRTISLIGYKQSVHLDDDTNTIERCTGMFNGVRLDVEDRRIHQVGPVATPLEKQIDNFVFSVMTNNLNSVNGIDHIKRTYENLQKIRNPVCTLRY